MGTKGYAKSSGPRPIPKAGMHKARLVWVIDLGTQQTFFKGEPKLVHQIKLCYELPEAMHTFDEAKGPQPFMVSKIFTVSVSKKSNTRPFIESQIGRDLTPAEEKDGYDFSNLLLEKKGCCMINIKHAKDEKDPSIVYANIAAVTPPIEGSKYPKPINPIIDYSIGSEKQWEEFEKVYPALQEKIKKSPEWQGEAAKAGYTGKAVASPEGEDEELDEDKF